MGISQGRITEDSLSEKVEGIKKENDSFYIQTNLNLDLLNYKYTNNIMIGDTLKNN